MGRGQGPTRGRPPMGPPGEDGRPFHMGPPEWGPPPPGGWGPPPPEEWGPPPPGGWGPPPPGGWGPLPPDGWGPRGPPSPGWGPRGPPPPDWGGHPDDWLPPPEHWRPPHPDDWRLPHPDDWRSPHPDDWRPPHPDDWRLLHPDDWRPPHPDDWRPPHPDGWRPPPHLDDWRPPPGWGTPDWGPEGPPESWAPQPVPPGPVPPVPPPPPVGLPPPDPASFGPVPVPPIPPPACPPPLGFPAYPPPGWTGEPVVEEAMPNPPPDQPEWIKALISAPPGESTPAETKQPTEEPAVSNTAVAEPDTAPKPKPKSDSVKTTKALGLLGKRMFEKPPPGRSTGIISFIGPTFGYIEREDLEKFTFSFEAFFGNPKAMTPGVRVHFTACKEKLNSLIATDVKVAPGGTENVGTEIYEAVVSQPIQEPQPGERQYPGQVYVNIGQLRTNLTFDRKDSTVTLLKNDQVLINLLTDIVTEKRRATNIKPQIPATFSHTKETRGQGAIISLTDSEGVIKSDEHGELPFNIRENFSDIEFTAEDVNEEVEFTVITLKAGKQAIRIRRVKEPLLLTLCTATATEEAEIQDASDNSEEDLSKLFKCKSNAKADLGPNMKLDPELYEGIVSQPIIEPTPTMQGYPGQIHANIGPVKTNVTFDHRDCGVTLLKNDHVLINLLVDMVTRKRRAANIKPKIPFTFSYTKEKRELGIITCLGTEEGIINSEEHGELPFDICENFSDTKFDASDIHKEVEFTVAMVKSKKRAIRLMRTKRVEDKILEEQKKREEEEKRKKREEEEKEREKEAEKKKKEEVVAALAAAKCKWTPLGFKMRDRDSLDDISKERFEGTVLKAIPKTPRKEIKKELEEGAEGIGGEGEDEDRQTRPQQVKIKVEKMDEYQEGEGKPEGNTGEEGKMEVKEDEEVKKHESAEAGGEAARGDGAKPEPETGRLVMTIDGQQKQLPFGPNDLLSTATMLDGDKVRFNIATHRDTKAERATYVEILPDSFEESTEQRRHGIVIEFSEDSGLIKCTQNPQMYFHMSEVIEKKKLELNEKVEFSVVPHETAEGGNQAIRIKRYTESVFLPVRKLGGVGTNKGKMTIKLTKVSEDIEKEKPETDKLKAVVKNLRAQDSKSSISRRDCSATRHRYGHSKSKSRSRSHSRSRARSRSQSRSRSPSRDQFGRIIKRRRSTSIDRDHKSSRYRQSRSRDRSHRRTRSHSRSRSRSKSSSRSRSRSRERSKDRARKKRSKVSRDCEDSHKRRRELSPPPRRVMDDELARKKRELEELNEMIAYKKSLVDIDPGQRTCIDYDHGRIAVPLTEYKPVRSILKNRSEGPEYLHRPPQPYDDPYYDRPYSPYQDRRYGDRYSDPYASRLYSDRPYGDRPYRDHPYENRLYGEATYSGPPSASQRYTDRYDVYDEPYDDRYYDPAYVDRPYDDPYRSVKRSQSPELHGPSPSSQSGHVPASASTHPTLTHSVATSSSQPSFRPPSPTEPPPRSPSPKLINTTAQQSPTAEKPPLDRFLDMLNKKVDAEKKSGPVYVNDDLLPHERALQDGRGFSRILGLVQDHPSSSRALEEEKNQPSPKRSSVERTSEEPKNKTEPYDKIQSLLRTIGLKLSTGDVSKLASQAQEKGYGPKSSSADRETLASPREELRTSRTGSVELDHIHSPSPVRSSSLEPLSRHKATSEYEAFLDQQELEALKKAQEMQSLTKSMGSTSSNTVKPPPGPPPTHYQPPPLPVSWPLGVTNQIPAQVSTAPSLGTSVPPTAGQPPQTFGPTAEPPPRRTGQLPPGPPPGPPPRRTPGQPPFTPPSSHAVYSPGQTAAPSQTSSSCLQSVTIATESPTLTPATLSLANNDQSTISTTVARCLKVIETVKCLAVQPPAKPAKSVQFSLPSETSAVSCLQTSAETDDDIKTKQKEKLDLYNQRILEKREQHYKEMLARKKQGEKSKDGTLISPGKPVSSEPKNVWICGHSLVYWAESRAKSPEVGMQLGMDPRKVTIWWKGIQGMTWSQLLPQLHQLKVTWPNPDVLIIHLGGNDLSTDSPTDLLASVKKDLTSMRSIFPQCVLVWSNILPRRVWRHSADSHEVDLVRTTVNRRIQNIISELGGTSLTHDNIRCGTNTGLYRADGVHLSPKGIDVFNLNLQDFLEKWEMEMNTASE